MTGWEDRAACSGMSTSLFYSMDDAREQKIQPPDGSLKAFLKDLCGSCPVLSECREHALTFPETYGFWGGMTSRERKRFLQEQQRRKAS